jgi:hypothetical protein
MKDYLSTIINVLDYPHEGNLAFEMPSKNKVIGSLGYS